MKRWQWFAALYLGGLLALTLVAGAFRLLIGSF